MKILVISLPTASQRRLDVTVQFEKLGLEFEFFDAIDGRKGVPEKFHKYVNYQALDEFWRPLTTAEIACALTHAFACEYVFNSLEEPTIILEDDAILATDFAILVGSGLLEKSGFELVLLYHNNTRAVKWPKRELFAQYHLRVPLKAPWGAVAYFVTPTSARKIVDLSLPIAGVADWGFDILDLKTSCIVPRIVEHPPIEASQSTMTERGMLIEYPKHRRKTLWQKIFDKKYRRYFYRKVRSEWIYKP